MALITDLKSRGLIHDCSDFDGLSSLLEKQQIVFYCGFDPTSDSLHVGSMLPLLVMRRFQQQGHIPVVLIGSATGMVGDPSGKSEERKLLDKDILQKNVQGIERQIGLFLSSSGKNPFRMVRNHEWLEKLSAVEFLRDVGKHFSVNMMMGKDSVRSRLENREQGISYTEFSYMLLQAYDFYHLHQQLRCQLQVGGSDQWGNITAGIELIRRKGAAEALPAYACTFPLLTTSTGSKFGKTERGAVWLDPTKTSPYHFYQYWLNTADADVIRYLKLFTEIPENEIARLEGAVRTAAQDREAQHALAKALTSLVHGESAATLAVRSAEILFGGQIAGVDAKTLLEIFSEVPSSQMPRNEITNGMPIHDLLVRAGVAKSKNDARRLIEGGGVYLNNVRLSEQSSTISASSFIDDSILIVRSGKKNYYLVQLA